MGDASDVALGSVPAQLGLGGERCEVRRVGDAGDIGLGGQACQVGAGRQVRDLALGRIPSQLGLGGQARQVGLFCVLGKVDLAARRRLGDLSLGGERLEVRPRG